MSVSKAKKQRYWLALMLDDLAVGEIFEPGRLHITIIPWFVTDNDEPAAARAFYKEFSGQKSFTVQVGEEALFGPKHDVNVNLIEPIISLLQLHSQALHWFEAISARWAVKRPHVGQEYIPHIRRRRGTKLTVGEEIQIKSLSLVAADRRENNHRRVAARIDLDED